MSEYRSVKLPNELIEEIKRIITEHKELGYMSHSEFIKDATRRRLEVINEKLDNVIHYDIAPVIKIFNQYRKKGGLQVQDLANALNISMNKLLRIVSESKQKIDLPIDLLSEE